MIFSSSLFIYLHTTLHLSSSLSSSSNLINHRPYLYLLYLFSFILIHLLPFSSLSSSFIFFYPLSFHSQSSSSILIPRHLSSFLVIYPHSSSSILIPLHLLITRNRPSLHPSNISIATWLRAYSHRLCMFSV